MQKPIEYLISRLEKGNVLSISPLPLSPLRDTKHLAYSKNCFYHHSALCEQIKKDRANHKICLEHKNRKVAYALENSEPFFDICPFGVLDYVCRIKSRNPLFILFITYTETAYAPRRAARALMRIPENRIAADPRAASYYQQIQPLRTIMEAALFAGIDMLSLPAKENPLTNKIYIARDLVNDYFKIDISLKKIATSLHVSEPLLARYYKKIFGVTMHDDINNHRIAYAKQLLDKNYPITETAFEAGYHDTSYFCRIFKRIAGTTPRGWKSRESRA
ncbi:MAG: helix-turn-helix transcriptional regulator [Spirochaetes bacterium]|nr:helix-turn-helix transcriptional regulator [Spirochaetota bacterium]